MSKDAVVHTGASKDTVALADVSTDTKAHNECRIMEQSRLALLLYFHHFLIDYYICFSSAETPVISENFVL